ncbi:MAG: deoxynucleoside kinase [Anaerolineae bacterium]|nr:deoxynucleoside kinase [Anaerolineae bacterium]
MNKKYIVIAGNIGVGKSTLVDLLCHKLDWQPFFEPEAENPYLADFYASMQRWSFHSQIYFLARRLESYQELEDFRSSTILDRSIYEDAEIFAHNLYLQGHLNHRDYDTYRILYESVVRLLPPPDLVIYLRASVPTLLQRITLRGRSYEAAIDPAYLAQLNELYEDWIGHFTLCPVLTVPADRLDYVARPEHLEQISLRVQQRLAGKEEVHFDD